MNKLDQMPYDENDQKHGEWLHYYHNGQLMLRRNYLHGELHGLRESYDLDGKLKRRCSFNNGHYHGISEAYFDGKLDRFCIDHMGENLLFTTSKIKILSLSL